MQSFSGDKGITIRYPSTANLMIDSNDRPSSNLSCWNFQITKPQALINGFFSRIGATEMVLEWAEPNVSVILGNRTAIIDISGVGGNTFNGIRTVDVSGGFCTARDVIDQLVAQLNALAGTGTTFTINQFAGGVEIEATGAVYKWEFTKLADQLGLTGEDEYLNITLVQVPDLRPYRYIDFVCDNLTAVQDVKDSSTQSSSNHNVLLRWYFAEDVPEQEDGYGFPILPGYNQFVRRRIYNPPKQIRWEQALPVGNLLFNVYDPEGNILPIPTDRTEWLMTLQLSEN